MRVATKRATNRLAFKNGIYDLSPPFDGCKSVMVLHVDETNYAYELTDGSVGRELYSQRCDNPDDTIRSLGYWIVV